MTARRTLVIMLAGPLEHRPRGWCRTGEVQVVAPSSVMGKLGAEGLVATGYVGARLRARLTPRGQTWARAAAIREADLVMAGALAGFDWLQERAAKEAAKAATGPEGSP